MWPGTSAFACLRPSCRATPQLRHARKPLTPRTGSGRPGYAPLSAVFLQQGCCCGFGCRPRGPAGQGGPRDAASCTRTCLLARGRQQLLCASAGIAPPHGDVLQADSWAVKSAAATGGDARLPRTCGARRRCACLRRTRFRPRRARSSPIPLTQLPVRYTTAGTRARLQCGCIHSGRRLELRAPREGRPLRRRPPRKRLPRAQREPLTFVENAKHACARVASMRVRSRRPVRDRRLKRRAAAAKRARAPPAAGSSAQAAEVHQKIL